MSSCKTAHVDRGLGVKTGAASLADKLNPGQGVAKLARRLAEGRWHVTITGHLGAGDLLRLERTCAPALDRYPIPLNLRVEHLTGIDGAARLFLSRLLERGAVLVGTGGEAAGELRAATGKRVAD